jgi:recombinase
MSMSCVRNNIPWSPEDDDLLRHMAASGIHLRNIANELNRSPGSVRVRAYRLKVKIAESGRLTACPAWLDLSEDRRSFVLVPDRAEIVRQIFEMSLAGLGGYTIAKQLNTKNVPAFGPSPKWDQSTIHNMLTNRATIGEHQPKRYEEKKEFAVGDPIPNYYPAVIREDLFYAAQEARRKNLASGRGRKGRLITNLFGGLLTCAYCGEPVKFHSNGNAKSLICSTVLANRGCHRMAWSYRSFESSFFKLLTDLAGKTNTAEEQEAAGKLTTLIERMSASEVYDVRLDILATLRATVSECKIAAAGATPIAGRPDAHIRRDGPGRYFEFRFVLGSSYIGFPANP